MPLSYKRRTYNRENEISAEALNWSFTVFVYLKTSPRGLDNSRASSTMRSKGNGVGSNCIQQTTVRGDSASGSSGVHYWNKRIRQTNEKIWIHTQELIPWIMICLVDGVISLLNNWDQVFTVVAYFFLAFFPPFNTPKIHRCNFQLSWLFFFTKPK